MPGLKQINTITNVHNCFYKHVCVELCKTTDEYILPKWYNECKITKHQITGVASSGYVILENLRAQLDAFGYRRSEVQKQTHEYIIVSSARKIFEKEWATQFGSIMKSLNIHSIKVGVIMICPRRFGKTWAIAMFCAAYLRWVPNCEIAVFATGIRMSTKLQMAALQFLLKIKGIENFITKKTNETLELTFGPGDKRIMCSYPSSSKVCIVLVLVLVIVLLALLLTSCTKKIIYQTYVI